MFDVSFGELVLVFVIGLLVLGPERLPKVATQIGRWVGKARRTANQLRHQLEREIALSEIAESQKRRAAETPKPSPAPPPPDAPVPPVQDAGAGQPSENPAGKTQGPPVAE